MIKTDSDIQENISASHFQKLQIFISELKLFDAHPFQNLEIHYFYFHFNADPLCRKTNLTCNHEILKGERQIKELSFKVSLFAERNLTCVNITIY